MSFLSDLVDKTDTHRSINSLAQEVGVASGVMLDAVLSDNPESWLSDSQQIKLASLLTCSRTEKQEYKKQTDRMSPIDIDIFKSLSEERKFCSEVAKDIGRNPATTQGRLLVLRMRGLIDHWPSKKSKSKKYHSLKPFRFSPEDLLQLIGAGAMTCEAIAIFTKAPPSFVMNALKSMKNAGDVDYCNRTRKWVLSE